MSAHVCTHAQCLSAHVSTHAHTNVYAHVQALVQTHISAHVCTRAHAHAGPYTCLNMRPHRMSTRPSLHTSMRQALLRFRVRENDRPSAFLKKNTTRGRPEGASLKGRIFEGPIPFRRRPPRSDLAPSGGSPSRMPPRGCSRNRFRAPVGMHRTTCAR